MWIREGWLDWRDTLEDEHGNQVHASDLEGLVFPPDNKPSLVISNYPRPVPPATSTGQELATRSFITFLVSELIMFFVPVLAMPVYGHAGGKEKRHCQYWDEKHD